jgi:hypothetical protein
VHPTLPILPHTATALSKYVKSAPAFLKEALILAVQAAIQSATSSSFEPQAIQRSLSLLTIYHFSDESRSFGSALLHLQTLLLLAIEAGNHEPPGARKVAGPSRTVLLGQAVGLANSMGLHVGEPKELAVEEESDKMARRVWFSLVVLDRFHACGTCQPLFIPDSSVTLLVEDQPILGEGLYYVASKWRSVELPC